MGLKMGYKSRIQYKSICLKKCANRGKECDTCIVFKGEYTNFKKKDKQ